MNIKTAKEPNIAGRMDSHKLCYKSKLKFIIPKNIFQHILRIWIKKTSNILDKSLGTLFSLRIVLNK